MREALLQFREYRATTGAISPPVDVAALMCHTMDYQAWEGCMNPSCHRDAWAFFDWCRK